MILYLDTSALVKIYVEEAKSAVVREHVQQAEGLATSRIAYAEARAALARKRREQGLSRADYRSVVSDLDQDWADYFIVDVSESVVRAAGLLAGSHVLRGAGAIHLASAAALSKQAGERVMFGCFDGRLAAAARKEDLRVIK
ncbi:MAG: type II toxin-antitoxin system VapC family toxin [Candidatus Binatia bacterium]